MEIVWSYVKAVGTVAWIGCNVNLHRTTGGETKTYFGRLIGILEKRAGEWLFHLVHYEFPYGVM
ncbi:MAG: hypothetical protein ACE5JP_10675 [Candidatus Bipolaricaulia bacterium]